MWLTDWMTLPYAARCCEKSPIQLYAGLSSVLNLRQVESPFGQNGPRSQR